jgi:hypothetical protein
MTFRFTARGACAAGADSVSGVPLESNSDAVEVSLLALPKLNVPPVAASANPGPPISNDRVTATAAGLPRP